MINWLTRLTEISFCSAEIPANLVYFFPYDSSRKSARPTGLENCLMRMLCFVLFRGKLTLRDVVGKTGLEIFIGWIKTGLKITYDYSRKSARQTKPARFAGLIFSM